jgi:hypothetical protein
VEWLFLAPSSLRCASRRTFPDGSIAPAVLTPPNVATQMSRLNLRLTAAKHRKGACGEQSSRPASGPSYGCKHPVAKSDELNASPCTAPRRSAAELSVSTEIECQPEPSEDGHAA